MVIYDNKGYAIDIDPIEVDASRKYEPDIYKFYVHAKTLTNDFYFSPLLTLYVFCGD